MIKKTIYILLIFGIASSAAIFYYANRAVAPTQNLTDDLEIFTDELVSKSTEKQSLETFDSLIESAVTFEGKVNKIKYDKDIYTLLIFSNKLEKELICSFQLDQNNKLKNLKNGDLIKVKGVYKGFLTNMIFQNCILN